MNNNELISSKNRVFDSLFDRLFGYSEFVWINGQLTAKTEENFRKSDIPALLFRQGNIYFNRDSEDPLEIETRENIDHHISLMVNRAQRVFGEYNLPNSVLLYPGNPILKVSNEIPLEEFCYITLFLFAMVGKSEESVLMEPRLDGQNTYDLHDVLGALIVLMTFRAEQEEKDLEEIFGDPLPA